MTAPRYRVLRISTDDSGHRFEIAKVTVDDLSEGNVVVAPLYSAVNYKDSMAALGTAPILRTSPLVGGIDAAGTVVRSDDEEFSLGQQVLVTGCGLSETRDGGFAERLRVPGDILIDIPQPLTPRSAMILGTAGLTAMLAVMRLEDNGLSPEHGPVLVTGASGGVGSIAVLLLSALGYRVFAMTTKPAAHEYLQELGAEEIWEPGRLVEGQALAHAEIAAAIDTLGGDTLPALASITRPWGCVVCIGRARGETFEGSVMPFIIRGVSILGISSANCPMSMRKAGWTRLAETLGAVDLEALVHEEVELDGLAAVFERLRSGQGRGRTLVRINRY